MKFHSAAFAALLVVCAAAVSAAAPQAAPAVSAAAPQAAPPIAVQTSDPARERLHRQLTERGERASRAFRQPSPPPPTNGIIQLPLGTPKAVPAAAGRQTAAIPIPNAPPPCPNPALNPLTGLPLKSASLVRAFPDVTWHVCVTDMGLKSLWVGPVHLKRGSNPWITVLKQAGLADIFVPYHASFFRPYDLHFTSQLDPVTVQDAGNGSQIVLSNETDPTVVAEVRDRGIGWLCKDVTTAVRRAQEFVLWGVADGGNYDNIIQYAFQDDGGMTFRLGNTGYNSPTNPPPNEAHTHNGLWRIDIDLDGPNNFAWLIRHLEPDPTPLHARDLKIPILYEGAFPWQAPEFQSILVESTGSTNAFGNKLGYEFTPFQTGRSRHYHYPEMWTRNDFYVTAYHSSELNWVQNWDEPDNYLVSSVNGEWAVTDLVVWVKAAAHHDPTDEDRSTADLGNPNSWTGVTPTHWSGVDMRPHNLFDANPLGGPVQCS